MTAQGKPLSQRLGDRLYYYGTFKPSNGCGITRDEVKEVLQLEEVIQGLKVDLAAREAERDTLKETLDAMIIRIDCLQDLLDRVKEEDSLNKLKVAESALREAQCKLKNVRAYYDEHYPEEDAYWNGRRDGMDDAIDVLKGEDVLGARSESCTDSDVKGEN